jgi:hypothetical protein
MLHRFDWNEYLGTSGKSFIDNHDSEATPFVEKFKKYAEDNLTADEAEESHDISLAKAKTKLSKLKLDLTFKCNSAREPLLPADWPELKLEDKKHVLRCFLKAQYGDPAVSTWLQELIDNS